MSVLTISGPRDYTATDYRPDGMYSVTIQAGSWSEAKRICEERGLSLDGKLYATGVGITEEEADALLAALEECKEGLLQ